jgi:hypothetical protein
VRVSRHRISEVDHETRRGVCAVCGPVFLYQSTVRSKVYLVCSQASREASRNYAKNNPESRESNRLKQKYGITLVEYDQMVQEQDGKCARCEKPAVEMKIRLSVDHCHKTGVVRKLLCAPCNTYLGKLETHREQLARDLLYLDTGSFESVSPTN